jgi:hypothetical protein
MSLYFSNDKKIVEINTLSHVVSYDDRVFSIKHIGFISRTSGKIQTEEHTFSWSKNELHVYNQYKEEIDVLYTEKDVMKISNTSGTSEEEWIATFEMKKGHMMYLYKLQNTYKLVDIFEKKDYQLTLKTDSRFIKEYTTLQGTILYTNDKIPRYRWNGIPIGKV